MATTLTAAPPAAGRIQSIDILRGIVMVLMAIDHVRVYSGVPAGGPTAGVFFTRWVTHFCAPAFVFFAGTSAFLLGRKLGAELARYLVTRGLVLVALELSVLHAAWTFSLDFTHLLAGVIWMIGWCMILLAGLVRFSPRAIGTFGLVVIAAQQVLLFVPRALPGGIRAASMWLWRFLYLGGEVTLGSNGPTISVLYTIAPWIGVMAAGYAFGTIAIREPAERRRACLRIGLSATALFVAYGIVAWFLLPSAGSEGPKLFRILNPPKYPASQPFLLMTLGPAIALLPFAERAASSVARVFAVFGRVPMFYYLLHIPAIHAVSLLVWYLRDGVTHADWFASAPYVWVPEAQRWGLPLLYLVFATVVAVLYVPCRWFSGVKARQRNAWLRYL
jgi:uncharacterized membrane protein